MLLWIPGVIQILFVIAFMIYGLFSCGKSPNPKKEFHVISLSQTKLNSQKPSRQSQKSRSRSHHRSTHRSHHSRSKNNGEEENHHRRRRKQKKAEQQPKTQERETEQIPDSDYPEVEDPTPSQKLKREKEIEKEKRRRIKEGFYQERSDEDDTLEPIRSLKEECGEETMKNNNARK